MTSGLRVAVVVPVLDDWDCLRRLLPDVGAAGVRGSVSVIVVDDGSLEPCPLRAADVAGQGLERVEVVQLAANLGHQRAIAIGLARAAELGSFDYVVVMDSDGEDIPARIPELLAAAQANPGAAAVAQRGTRSEGVRFVLFYRLYRWLFTLLTGQRIDFGNFAVLPGAALTRLLHMPDLWNNFPATLIRSRLPIVRVRIDRGERYVGTSRMNFTSLVNHGLGAMSVFMDRTFVRLLVAVSVGLVAMGAVAVVALVVRLSTHVALPGWLALGGVVAALGLVQVLAVVTVATFIVTSARGSVTVPLAKRAHDYIRDIQTVSTTA